MDLRSIDPAVPAVGKDSVGQGGVEHRGCSRGGSADSAHLCGK